MVLRTAYKSTHLSATVPGGKKPGSHSYVLQRHGRFELRQPGLLLRRRLVKSCRLWLLVVRAKDVLASSLLYCCRPFFPFSAIRLHHKTGKKGPLMQPMLLSFNGGIEKRKHRKRTNEW
jgi:hypothetical protein